MWPEAQTVYWAMPEGETVRVPLDVCVSLHYTKRGLCITLETHDYESLGCLSRIRKMLTKLTILNTKS